MRVCVGVTVRVTGMEVDKERGRVGERGTATLGISSIYVGI